MMYTLTRLVCVCVCLNGFTVFMSSFPIKGWKLRRKTNLEDGVHDACERSIVRMLSHFENIQAPSVDVFQVLLERTQI